ncbi:MAG: hypothetical protein WC441_00605 [Patescibacteria group bacterium]
MDKNYVSFRQLVKKNYRYWLVNLVLVSVVWLGVRWLVYRPSTAVTYTKKSAAIQLTGNSMPTPPADGGGGPPMVNNSSNK